MSMLFLPIPIPAADGVGAAAAVNTIGPTRTFTVTGDFSGALFVQGSNDGGVTFEDIPGARFDEGGAQTEFDTVVAFRHVRVRRIFVRPGGAAPVVNIGGEEAGAAIFGTLVVPATNGVGPATSIALGGEVLTIEVSGETGGILTIEGTQDGVNFVPIQDFGGNGQSPVAQKAKPGFVFDTAGVQTIEPVAFSQIRVRRSQTVSLPPTPIVSFGSMARLTSGAGSGGGIADWPIGITRYYAVSNDLGNDANLGFSDTNMAAAVAVAKKTWGALIDIIPPVGAGRSIMVAIVPRAGGATYRKADGVTVDDLVWRGFVGYRYVGRVATDAGVNDLADKIKSGGIDATGLGVLTVAAVPAPTSGVFAATVALPAGLEGRRVRFLTGAQANQAAVLHQQTTTTLALDTVTVGTNITGAPAAGDTFMIERCGVAFNRVAVGFDSTAMENRPEFSVARAGDVTRGIAAKSTAVVSFDMRGPATQVAIGFCEDDGGGASSPAIDGPTTLVMTGSVRDETGTNIKVGSSLRTSGSGPPSITNVTSLAYSNSAFQGTGSPFFFNVSQALVLGAGSTWAVGARFDGCFGSLIDPPEPGANIGNGSLASPSRRLRVTGTAVAALAGLEIRCSAAVRGVEIINQGAKPCLALGASAAGYDINDVVGSTGNTDVGTAVGGTRNSVRIGRIEAVTVTGTLGDMRISAGAIATYAGLAFTNVVDNAGNDISGALGKVVSESVLVTNASGVTLAIGNIVRTTGVSGEVTRSLADTAANAGGDLLVMTTTPLNTALGYAVPFSAPAWVTFDAVPTPNVLSYLDEATAGVATQVVPPVAATNQKRRLGRPLRISGTLGLMTATPEMLPVTSDGVTP